MSESDNIEFEPMASKPVDQPKDSHKEALRDQAISKLEKSQADKQVRAEAGLVDIPKTPEQIPKELPVYLFKLGADCIKCDHFNLNDDEAKLLARHLSILVGKINSKWLSLLIILIVILSKITTCIGAVKNFFSKKTPEETEELKEQGRPTA